MSSAQLQAYVLEYFSRVARNINNDPSLLEGFEQAQGRSILVVLSDLVVPSGSPGCGLLLDTESLVRVVDPATLQPTLTVDTNFRTFMDIMDGKLDLDTAFYYNMVNVYGARFLADYLVIKEFFARLMLAANVKQ